MNSSSISHYNPLWVLAFSDRSFQTFLSVANSFQFLTFSAFRSSHTSSNHLNLGLPSDRLPIGFHSNILLAVLEVSTLCMWPNHLTLWALINLTISAPLITLSNSALFLVLLIRCMNYACKLPHLKRPI
jgi:hypothetical protein